jgi:TonB family protein
MLVYVFLLAAATVDRSTPEQIEQWCMDGTLSPKDARCPPTAPPAPPPAMVVKAPVPKPTLGRPPKPRNNPGLWVNTIDYPTRSLRDEEEGTSSFRLSVGPDGLVKACAITASSGSALLDAATCSNITRRARFEPALDIEGNPTVGSYSNRVAWRIPAGPSFARQTDFAPSGPQPTYGAYIEISESNYPIEALEKGMRGAADIVLSISEIGIVTDCQIELGTGYPLLDGKACEIARTWAFLPARGPDGAPINGRTRHLFWWVLPDAWKQYLRTGLYPPKPASQ